MEDTAIAIARHPTHISRKNNVNMYNAVKKWEDDFNYINEKYNSAEHVIPV